jgi:hypothetical protein
MGGTFMSDMVGTQGGLLAPSAPLVKNLRQPLCTSTWLAAAQLKKGIDDFGTGQRRCRNHPRGHHRRARLSR